MPELDRYSRDGFPFVPRGASTSTGLQGLRVQALSTGSHRPLHQATGPTLLRRRHQSKPVTLTPVADHLVGGRSEASPWGRCEDSNRPFQSGTQEVGVRTTPLTTTLHDPLRGSVLPLSGTLGSAGSEVLGSKEETLPPRDTRSSGCCWARPGSLCLMTRRRHVSSENAPRSAEGRTLLHVRGKREHVWHTGDPFG